MTASFLLLPLVALQSAAPMHDLNALDALALDAAGVPAGVPGSPARPVDRRLRLRQCPDAVEAVAEPAAIRLQCTAHGWRIFVPRRPAGSSESGASPASALAVRRGDAVRLVVSGRSFSVSMRAVALEDGAIGARIRLRRATGPALPMNATVTGPGEARLEG